MVKRNFIVLALALLFVFLYLPFGFQPVAQAATSKPADYIPSSAVPTVVERIFSEVFNKQITPAESTYWKIRARTDKPTQSSLRGAMLFQKTLGRTMPSAAKLVTPTPLASTTTSPFCNRPEPYPLAPELQAGMTVLKNGLLSQEPWKSALPVKKIQNCLNIKFANKDSDYALVEGALGVFLPKVSTINDLRIIINPVFAQDGHVLLGETMAHEITHAWQFSQDTLAAKKAPGFSTYKPLDCYNKEAQAFWTEISYINHLAEADQNDLHDVLHDAITFSPHTKRGAYQVLDLMSFANHYWEALLKNPIGFLRVNFVMPNPAYVQECS